MSSGHRLQTSLSQARRERVDRDRHLVVHSYGGGVQSRALFYMYVHGKIQRPDVVIFADTQQEPDEVYEAIATDQAVAGRHGIEFRCITNGDLGHPAEFYIHVPLFTTHLATGKQGQLRRTCTDAFKIKPIRREIRALGGKKATLWLGISTDEIERVKPSPVKWVEHRWPLIDIDYSREDCYNYLSTLGIRPTRSACTFCPYKGYEEWRNLTQADLDKAIAYDESIRHKLDGYECFVHRSRTPLRLAVKLPAKTSDTDECMGICWS